MSAFRTAVDAQRYALLMPTTEGAAFVPRFLALLTASAVLLTGALAATPAQAAPALRFHGAQCDSPGSDTRTNTSLNAEWISLINSGSSGVALKGWTIRDASRHVYTFGNVTIPGNGGRIWLHTGK